MLHVFEEDVKASAEDARLVVDLEGYEGPIDVLLTLARDQKVDLTHISILKLADQYLAFIARMRREELELAADYLVMAAWLAYLKSRLLLPEPQSEDEPTGAEMAAALAFQLQRLEAMQQAGSRLMARPLLDRDVFGRGEPEGVEIVTRSVFDVTLYDLLKAYADHKQRASVTTLHIEAPDLYSMDDAIGRLEQMLGRMPGWTTLQKFLPPGAMSPLKLRSAIGATFVATLELARQGKLRLRQDGGAFSPIQVSRT